LADHPFSIWPELATILATLACRRSWPANRGSKEPERRRFFWSPLSSSTWVQVLQQVCSADYQRNVMEAMQTLSALLPMGTLLGPYFYGFHSQRLPSTANDICAGNGQFRARCFTEY